MSVPDDAEALERRRSILEHFAHKMAHGTSWSLCDITLRDQLWLVTMQHASGTYQTASFDDAVLTGCSDVAIGHLRDVLRDIVSGDGRLAVAS